VSFSNITLCVVSQRVIIVVVYFVMTKSGNFWIHPRTDIQTAILFHRITIFIDVIMHRE
jgi:hypothetical protein